MNDGKIVKMYMYVACMSVSSMNPSQFLLLCNVYMNQNSEMRISRTEKEKLFIPFDEVEDLCIH